MRSSHLKDLLKQIDIEKYTGENLTLSEITNKILIDFEENKWHTEGVTRHTIQQFIKEELALTINPNKLRRNSEYWISCKEKTTEPKENEKQKITPSSPYDQISIWFNSQITKPSKTIDVLTKDVTDITESKTNNTSITLEDINSNIDTVIKNIDKLRTEIKTIERTKGDSSLSSESKEQNRTHVEEMIKLLGSDYETQSVSINSNLLKNIQKFIKEEYGIKDDVNKAINIALFLVWHGHR